MVKVNNIGHFSKKSKFQIAKKQKKVWPIKKQALPLRPKIDSHMNMYGRFYYFYYYFAEECKVG